MSLWYDYMKPKYGEKAKLCYIDTDSFIVYKKNIRHSRRQKILKQDLIFKLLTINLSNRKIITKRKK